MKTLKICILSFAGCSTIIAEAQITNLGELVLARDTQLSANQSFINSIGASFINDGDTFFYSDLTNNGVLDFTFGSNGVTEFSSNTPQSIAGSEFCYFNNLVFNNTTSGIDNIRLNTTISVANELNFTNGIVNGSNASVDVIFENNARAFNVSDESFVDGVVEKLGKVAFDFPIGDLEFYRPTSISAPILSSAAFSARYHFENADAKYPFTSRLGVIKLINNKEYWTIENTSGDESIFITLSWDFRTTPESIIAAPQSAILILRWDEAQKLWVSEGGVVDEATNSITTRTELSDYGVFTLGRVDEDIISPGGVVIYNAISTNVDGKNDYFIIENIKDFPNNKVEIFNRWGTTVFKTTDYDTKGNVFRGVQESGKPFLGSSDGYLPSGTYFYVISYDYKENNTTQTLKKAGYLYLSSN